MAINIAFCPHFHQPYFQLHLIREGAFLRCYVPFLQLLKEMKDVEGFYINLHFSGPFLSWIIREKPWYLEELRQLVEAPTIGVIGGLLDEPFIQLSGRRDDILYQLEGYARLVEERLGVSPQQWEGLHVVEREAGEWLLSGLARASGMVGAPPVVYLDAETFFQPHYALPGGEHDYCRHFFGFEDAHSRTTIPHLPPEVLYFPVRDEFGGNKLYIFPIHAQFRYMLLKRMAFGAMDRVKIKPRQYLFHIKEAGERAMALAAKLGKRIEPVVLIFEDAEKFGEWSKDPKGDALWLREFFELVIKDPDLKLGGLKRYLNEQGFLTSYPVSSSHSYPEWENWTAKRGIRGVNFGDERLRKVLARHRQVERRLNELEKMVLEGSDTGTDVPKNLVLETIMDSLQRYQVVKHVLINKYPPEILRAYEAVQRARHMVYQEDPRWASRHPSYGSGAYFDTKGLGYLEMADRLLDQLQERISGKAPDLPEVEVGDWDGDGQDKVMVRTAGQTVVVDCCRGEVVFQQAWSGKWSDLATLAEALLAETSIPEAYSQIERYSCPLVLTETDSDLVVELGGEGERVERCRNCFQLRLAARRNGEYDAASEPTTNFRLVGVDIDKKEHRVTITLENQVKIGNEGAVKIRKVIVVERDSLLMQAEAETEKALSEEIYMVPELVSSATPSDEKDFLPYCWMGIKGGEELVDYRFFVGEGVEGKGAWQKALMPAPLRMVYVYSVRTGDDKEFVNSLTWEFVKAQGIKKVEVRPAVRHYYRGHVFDGPSRLGYHASGVMIRPYLKMGEGGAGFAIKFRWNLDAKPSAADYDWVMVLLESPHPMG